MTPRRLLWGRSLARRPAAGRPFPWPPLLPLALTLALAAHAQSPAGTDCRHLQLHDQTAAAAACFQRLAASPDPYTRAEGEWGLDDFADANNDFRTAAAHHPHSALDRVRWGRLLQARFNDTDAEGLFQEALKIAPNDARAYFGMALVSADGFDGKAEQYARHALTLDPKLAQANVLLARMALEDSDPVRALADADQALATQPDDLDAMAVHAAAEVLATAPPPTTNHQPPTTWLSRISAINPHYGQADALVADQLVLHRRYQQALAYYQQATTLSPDLWSAHSSLGVTLMRLGQFNAARPELVAAYDHDYRDVATVNSLRLLDSLKNFDRIQGPGFVLQLGNKESALLRPYFEDLMRRAMAAYSAMYSLTLAVPIQVEAYPNHADFAVRSIGLPGLGALGVTFGAVIAMDSPSARMPGEFNWADTLWHEMDHVYVLTLTHHLVPRWFAEGLAVHEETQANPTWGDRATPEVLAAIRDHKLLPVAGLDRGFMHPSYPDQVTVSYFQAGRICDYIQDHWSASKLVEMVHDFAVPTTTAAVVLQALGETPAQFDLGFNAWLNQTMGAEANGLAAWETKMKALTALTRSPTPDPAAVITLAGEVQALYPDYIYDGNAYLAQAHAYLAEKQPDQAIATLASYQTHGGQDPAALMQLASLEAAASQPQQAAATLAAVNDIYPENPDLHQQLGALYLLLNQPPNAVREFTAALALHPLDQAGAQYHLAEAYFAAGDLKPAQDHVIAALVAAHDYQPAQQLLLKITATKHQQPISNNQ
ncbi:MAG: tetratricopeptide repeat protein [Terriglobales bacterium]